MSPRKFANPLHKMMTAVAFVAAAVILTTSSAAFAQHCKVHYSEAFQIVDQRPLAGRSIVEIKSFVDDVFRPRKDVCGASSYKFFLSELKTYAGLAFRKKGPEGEAMLFVTREIISRVPAQVRFAPGEAPDSGLKQLRSDLGVLGSEVGMSPSVQGVLDALAKATPPRPLARPMPADDDATPIVVPKVPLPAWAVVSLYEIRDHAKRKENGAILNKTQLILDWMARINAGAPPGDVKVAPAAPGAAPPPAAAAPRPVPPPAAPAR